MAEGTLSATATNGVDETKNPSIRTQITELIRQGETLEAIQVMKATSAYSVIGSLLEERLHGLQRRNIEGGLQEANYFVALQRLKEDILLALGGTLLWLDDLESPTPSQADLGKLAGAIVKNDLREFYEQATLSEVIPQEFRISYSEVLGSWSEPPTMQTLSSGGSLSSFFQEMKGYILLLGPAGSGKSFTIKRMALEMMQKAQIDQTHPLPIILRLNSWQPKALDLTAWIIGQIAEIYLIDKTHVRAWIEEGRILLFLDSLDSVAIEERDDCVEAINRFRNSRPLPGLVVASRDAGYREAKVKLQLEAALHLIPLSPQVVTNYLYQLPRNAPELIDAVQSDNGLLQLATTPLALRMLPIVFASNTQSVLTGRYDEARRNDFYAAYIDSLFVQQKSTPPFTEKQSRHWLAWMASGMQQDNEPILRFEQFQPTWIPNKGPQLFYFLLSRTILGLAAGLLGGIVIGLGLGISAENLWRGIIEGMSGGLSGGLILGLWGMALLMLRGQPRRTSFLQWSRIGQIAFDVFITTLVAMVATIGFFMLVLRHIDWSTLVPEFATWTKEDWFSEAVQVGLVVGLSFGLVFGVERNGVQRRASSDIQTASLARLKWSNRSVPIFAAIAMLLGGIAGVVLFLNTPIESTMRTPISDYIYNLGLRNNGAATGMALFGIIFCGLATALIAGLSGSTIAPDSRTGPDQAIGVSLRNGLWVGGIAALILAGMGFLVGLIGTLEFSFDNGSTYNYELAFVFNVFGSLDYALPFAFYGIFIGYLVFLAFGGLDTWLYSNLRLALWFSRCTPAPGQYRRFLTYCRELQLLDAIHGGYQFRHPTWQSYFAERFNKDG